MSDAPDAKKPRIEEKKEDDTVVPKRKNLIDYDGQNMNHYNVILIVENQKFHVSKEVSSIGSKTTTYSNMHFSAPCQTMPVF